MKVKNLYKLIFVFFLFVLSGCDFFGPNPTTQTIQTTQATTQTTTQATTQTTTQLTTAEVVTESDLTIQLKFIYELAVEANTFSGTYEEWLETVRGPQGEAGREVTFQIVDNYIQWQYSGDTSWTNLVDISTLIGPAGSDGTDGTDGKSAYEIYLENFPNYEGNELQWLNDLINGDLLASETFTVSFDSNGGSTVESQIVEDNDKAVKPTDPTREGFVFDGWYTDDDEQWMFSGFIVTENVVLTALWQPTQWEIALITDVGNIDDESFNEAAWNGVVEYAEANDISYAYYQPTEDTNIARIEQIEIAIDNGAKIIVCPGFLFGPVVYEMQQDYPDIAFLLLDGETYSEDYLTYLMTDNTHSILYQEEQSGFLAGYAAVMEGYRNLGFIGGVPVPAVVRFGYGFIQGAECAASELGLAVGDVSIKYDYADVFWPTPELESQMDLWYAEGTEIIFACGGGLYSSVVSAAEKTVNGKVIGVDFDQAAESDRIITSALKELETSVMNALTEFYDNDMEWPVSMAGETALLGAENGGVGLPTTDTSWRFETFTIAEYNEIYAKLVDGTIVVSQDIDVEPTVTLVVPLWPIKYEYEIALITDVGNIDDGSYNEAAWNGVVEYAEANDISYAYYRPTEINNLAIIEQIEIAIVNGAKIIICPGYLFSTAVYQMQQEYPYISFLLLDDVPHSEDFTIYSTSDNTHNILYQEEQAGFLAGYAAVMDGYRDLGFIGGMAVPAIVRYGYGFIQGAEYAALELGLSAGEVTIKYDYANVFWEDASLESQMDSWYAEGTEIIFACGGGLYLSVVAAAENTINGQVIGVDIDQSADSERIITSAIKILTLSVVNALGEFYDNNMEWPTSMAGNTALLGADNDGIGLPTTDSSWRFDSFTIEDYAAIYTKLVNGTVVVSQEIGEEPTVVLVTVSYEE